MTTIAVTKKNGVVAIAADSLTTFGDTRLAEHHKHMHDKILRVRNSGAATGNGLESLVAVCGSSAHYVVLENTLARAEVIDFSSRAAVYETVRKLHTLLKDHAFLNTKEDEDDPYESSQITALIANETGIYAVYSYREVFDFERFWAAGSGRNFALGAMYAAYDRARNAGELARLGVLAGCEFDRNSGGPVEVHTFKLRATPRGAERARSRT
jgi:ATP-dependent HslUV protease subunit HslV